MLAAVLYGLNDVRLKECPIPEPGPDDVLIKVKACGVCGGDIKIIKTGMPHMPPFGEFIIGHEYAGEIVATGQNADEFKKGDRVTVEVHKGCGRCVNCILGKYTVCLNYANTKRGHRANGFTTDGGFAQYAVNHVATLCPIPDNISFDEATLATTCGTSLFALDKAGFMPADTVVVIGPGAIGLMCIQCAKALGAGKIILTGTRDDRLLLGKDLGADHVINVDKNDPVNKVLSLTNGAGADIVLVAAGSKNVMQNALLMTRRGGNITVIAHFEDPVMIDMGLAVKNGIDIHTVRGEGKRSIHRAISLMAQGAINANALITHRFSLYDINTALDVFTKKEEHAVKIIIHP